MIHYTPEGSELKIGLNWTFNLSLTKFWFRFIFVWYNSTEYTATSWYFRFKWFWKKFPTVHLHKNSWNVFEHYIFERDLVLIKRTEYEDLKGI